MERVPELSIFVFISVPQFGLVHLSLSLSLSLSLRATYIYFLNHYFPYVLNHGLYVSCVCGYSWCTASWRSILTSLGTASPSPSTVSCCSWRHGWSVSQSTYITATPFTSSHLHIFTSTSVSQHLTCNPSPLFSRSPSCLSSKRYLIYVIYAGLQNSVCLHRQ